MWSKQHQVWLTMMPLLYGYKSRGGGELSWCSFFTSTLSTQPHLHNLTVLHYFLHCYVTGKILRLWRKRVNIYTNNIWWWENGIGRGMEEIEEVKQHSSCLRNIMSLAAVSHALFLSFPLILTLAFFLSLCHILDFPEHNMIRLFHMLILFLFFQPS